MSFGKTLKRIRLKHKDSLRGLAKKIDLHFTFIDKVESLCQEYRLAYNFGVNTFGKY